MPWPTPFHPRTQELCTSLLYKEWAGCYAVRRYDVYHEREYYALRHAATLMDVTPLYKYDVKGRDAATLLSQVMVRGFTKHKSGRVSYVCWCDHKGKVLDDGTVTRLAEDHFRVTSTEPSFAWLQRHSRRLRVEVEDISPTWRKRPTSLSSRSPSMTNFAPRNSRARLGHGGTLDSRSS